MSLPQGNPRIPEGINARDEHPLKEFAVLAAGVAGALLAAVFALSLAARWLAPYIPFAWELQAAEPLEAMFAAEPDEDEEEDQPARRAALQQLARAILQSSLAVSLDGEAPGDSVPAEHFKFLLLPMEVPNAFATLGANVAVTAPLMAQVQSENGLAMVLAHEIAHVQLRHPIEAAGRGIVIQIALTAALGASSNSLLGSSLGAGGLLTMLSFNRDMELEADRRALAILRQHYGHTAGADEFFLSMEKMQDSEDWLEFTRTHPDTERRLEIIRAEMARDSSAGATRPLPRALQAEKQ
jgi:predicted Zn-dependent protease